MGSEQILIVDDEQVIQELLFSFLSEKGYRTTTAGSAEEAIARLADTDYDVVLCDIRLPGKDGLLLLNDIKHITPETEVIMITGHASMESSIEAVRMGAYDYLLKPFDDLDEVRFTVERALEKKHLSLANKKLLHDYERQNDKLVDSARMFDSFLKAVRTMNLVSSPDELLASIADLAANALAVDQTSVMLVDEQTGSLHMAAAYGLDVEQIRNTVIASGSAISGSVVSTGKPYLHQTRSTEEEKGTAGANAEPFPVGLCVPIMNGNRVVGTVNAAVRTNEEPFTAQDLDTILGIADLAGIALKTLGKDQMQGSV